MRSSRFYLRQFICGHLKPFRKLIFCYSMFCLVPCTVNYTACYSESRMAFPLVFIKRTPTGWESNIYYYSFISQKSEVVSVISDYSWSTRYDILKFFVFNELTKVNLALSRLQIFNIKVASDASDLYPHGPDKTDILFVFTDTYVKNVSDILKLSYSCKLYFIA